MRTVVETRVMVSVRGFRVIFGVGDVVGEGSALVCGCVR